MQKQDYLFELGCEELPSSAMQKLSLALEANIKTSLASQDLEFNQIESFAAPRRLAFIISGIDSEQPSKQIERRGPSKQAAYDQDGTPTLACLGFANSCGVKTDELQILETEKGSWVYCNSHQQGKATKELLPDIVQTAIKQLPIPKPMRWGSHDDKFIRPVHWITSLLDEEVVELNLFNCKAQQQSYGHRFMHPAAIAISEPKAYYERLLQFGKVMPSFSRRRQYISEQIKTAAKKLGLQPILNEGLLDEVTTLVEWPVVLTGQFPEAYLEVPQEALITAMQSHQKCFALVDANNKLQPHFILVSNIESKAPATVIKGNERVINARLSDAAFFYQQDRKHSLSSRLQKLEHVVFQKDLGSMASKSERISELAKHIAKMINANQQDAARAGLICKCDLLSEMVYEFPELQGIMGSYYAKQDDEGDVIATAIKEHYWPKFSGDNLPTTLVSTAVSLADKIDTLVGIIAINKLPKGDKDPFALKRAAQGIVRMLIENQLDIDLRELITFALNNLPSDLPNKNTTDQACEFILERLKTWCQDNDFSLQVFQAIAAKGISNLYDFAKRAEAVKTFVDLPEAAALAAANKRVNNILKKNKTNEQSNVDASLLSEEAEQALVNAITQYMPQIEASYNAADYTQTLTQLATFKEPVDHFFDKVMVMCDDKNIRQNRLAIIKKLQQLFTMVADLEHCV